MFTLVLQIQIYPLIMKIQAQDDSDIIIINVATICTIS